MFVRFDKKNLLQVLLKISLIKWMLTNSCNPVRRQHLTYSVHSTVSKSADFFSKPLDWFLYGRNSVLDVKKLAEKHRGIPSTYLKNAATWPFKFNMKHTWMYAFLKNLCNMKQGSQKTNQKVIKLHQNIEHSVCKDSILKTTCFLKI